MSKPTRYVVVAREFPVYGLAHEVKAEGSIYAIAMTATREQALQVAAAFTRAEIQACDEWGDTGRALRALEVERGEDEYRDRELASGGPR